MSVNTAANGLSSRDLRSTRAVTALNTSVASSTTEDPKPFEVSSLRNTVLVDLGVVETGQKREFTIRLVNTDLKDT